MKHTIHIRSSMHMIYSNYILASKLKVNQNLFLDFVNIDFFLVKSIFKINAIAIKLVQSELPP